MMLRGEIADANTQNGMTDWNATESWFWKREPGNIPVVKVINPVAP